jgi:hypothetical protein
VSALHRPYKQPPQTSPEFGGLIKDESSSLLAFNN